MLQRISASLLACVVLGVAPACKPQNEASPPDSQKSPAPEAVQERSPGPGLKDGGETPSGQKKLGGPGNQAAPAPGPTNASTPPAGPMTRLPSGLRYAVLKEGQGSTPPLKSVVHLHLKAWTLINGQKANLFLDTRKGGRPRPYLLSDSPLDSARQAPGPDAPVSLIPGLVEAVSSMKPGEQRQVRVPPHLGYGRRGYLSLVPANAELLFDVELVEVSLAAK